MKIETTSLPAGELEYFEMGSGPPVVFVHGLLAGPELWLPMARLLKKHFRCIIPTMPLGTHRYPMAKDADLSPNGLARLVGEFLDALELRDVILVGNDSGGAIAQLAVADHGQRIERLVLTNCDALEVFPPTLFKYLRWLAKIPLGYTALAMAVRWIPPLRYLPFAWGKLTVKPQRPVVSAWCKRLGSARFAQRDAARFARHLDPKTTVAVAERLAPVDKPILLLWGERDRHFKVRLAERFAAKMKNARLELISEATTYVALDQPEECASRLLAFAAKQREKAA